MKTVEKPQSCSSTIPTGIEPLGSYIQGGLTSLDNCFQWASKTGTSLLSKIAHTIYYKVNPHLTHFVPQIPKFLEAHYQKSERRCHIENLWPWLGRLSSSTITVYALNYLVTWPPQPLGAILAPTTFIALGTFHYFFPKQYQQTASSEILAKMKTAVMDAARTSIKPLEAATRPVNLSTFFNSLSERIIGEITEGPREPAEASTRFGHISCVAKTTTEQALLWGLRLCFIKVLTGYSLDSYISINTAGLVKLMLLFAYTSCIKKPQTYLTSEVRDSIAKLAREIFSQVPLEQGSLANFMEKLNAIDEAEWINKLPSKSDPVTAFFSKILARLNSQNSFSQAGTAVQTPGPLATEKAAVSSEFLILKEEDSLNARYWKNLSDVYFQHIRKKGNDPFNVLLYTKFLYESCFAEDPTNEHITGHQQNYETVRQAYFQTVSEDQRLAFIKWEIAILNTQQKRVSQESTENIKYILCTALLVKRLKEAQALGYYITTASVSARPTEQKGQSAVSSSLKETSMKPQGQGSLATIKPEETYFNPWGVDTE